MNFQGLQAQYHRLFDEDKAWKLLRADNAPMIMAFIATLFAEESEVPFSRARIALDAELVRCRELGIWETDTPAGIYLYQWIKAGWLREMNDMITQTDAGETALRFCRNLDDRGSVTTASHLRIVQEAVRDFVVAVSNSPEERMALLEKKKSQVQKKIDQLRAGVLTELTSAEQRERIREIYQLASVLTGDFRRVEDEIRILDQELRTQVIEADTSRGEVLKSVMEKETLLEQTDAGSAFESFFQLLCDQNRSAEFRNQLRSILTHPAAAHLSSTQHQFLNQLMRELTRESDRVFQIRRRTQEGLRNYIENDAALENRAVDQLLGRLEQMAVGLREMECSPRTATDLYLDVGAVTIASPEKLRPRAPEETLDTSNVQEKTNAVLPSERILSHLDAVSIRDVAQNTLAVLESNGPMTIGGVAEKRPLKSGLEELVACLRVAKAVGAVALDGKEKIQLWDREGRCLCASIPKFLLSADLFPARLEELNL